MRSSPPSLNCSASGLATAAWGINRTSGGYNAVQFLQVKETDLSWLRAMLNKVGLRSSQLRSYRCGPQVQMSIIDPAWHSLFDAEFGGNYTHSLYYHAAASTPPSTSRSIAGVTPPSTTRSLRSSSVSSTASLSIRTSSSPGEAMDSACVEPLAHSLVDAPEDWLCLDCSRRSPSLLRSPTPPTANKDTVHSDGEVDMLVDVAKDEVVPLMEHRVGAGEGEDELPLKEQGSPIKQEDLPMIESEGEGVGVVEVEDGEVDDEPPSPPPAMPLGPGVKWGPGVLPELIKPAKHLPHWVMEALSVSEMRLLINGLHRADGVWQRQQKVIDTSSARFRDELMQALLHCGYSPTAALKHRRGAVQHYTSHEQTNDKKIHSLAFRDRLSAKEQRLYEPIQATVDSWRVRWSVPDSATGQASCRPCMPRQGCITRVPYVALRDGPTW